MLRKRTLFKIGSSADANTILLLHLDNNLTDSGIFSKVLTTSGTTFSTSNKKFGTHCITNDTIGAGVNLLDNFLRNYVSNNFTIDYWVRPPLSFEFMNYPHNDFEIGSNADFYTFSPYLKGYWYYDRDFKYVYAVQVCGWNGSIGGTIDYKFNTTPNSPIHIAIIRDGNSLYLYINGSLVNSTSITENINTTYQIKSFLLPYGKSFIDEFRFSDTKRWSGNFSPPTAAY